MIIGTINFSEKAADREKRLERERLNAPEDQGKDDAQKKAARKEEGRRDHPRRLKLHEIVPSLEVRRILRKEKRTFTDKETATLLLHSCIPLEARDEHLIQICERTENEALKKGLKEIVERDKEAMRILRIRGASAIYAVSRRLSGDCFSEARDYFTGYDAAFEAGMRFGDEFRIEKEPIDGGAEAFGSSDATDGEPADLQPGYGFAVFDKKGRVLSANTYVPHGEADLVVREGVAAKPSIGSDWIRIPNPFERGDVVKPAGKGSAREWIGIIETRNEAWEENEKSMMGGERKAKGHVPVFWDSQVVITTVDGSGDTDWLREHPLFLQRVSEEEINNMPGRQSLRIKELSREMKKGIRIAKHAAAKEELKGGEKGRARVDGAVEGLSWEALIPSPEARELAEKEGWQFSDEDVATLVMNQSLPWKEKKRRLLSAAERTDDSELAKRIKKAVSRRDREMAVALPEGDAGSGEYVYVLQIESDDLYTYGYFARAWDAVSYGRKSECPFYVLKAPVYGRGSQRVLTPEELGDEELLEGDHYCDGDEDGYAWFDQNGDIWYAHSREVEIDEGDDECEESIRDRYVSVPNPFERGDIVTLVDDKSYVGIVCTSQDEWKEDERRVASNLDEEGRPYMDFSDVQIVVNDITEEGYADHRHVNPIELTLMPENEIADLPQRELVKAMSWVAKGRGDFQWMMMCYDKCAERRN